MIENNIRDLTVTIALIISQTAALSAARDLAGEDEGNCHASS
jgi:hypothetical protein